MPNGYGARTPVVANPKDRRDGEAAQQAAVSQLEELACQG